MLVTLFGIVTLVRLEHSLNAKYYMLVTSEPISSAMTFVTSGIYVVGVPGPLPLLISPVMLTVLHSVSPSYLYQVSA